MTDVDKEKASGRTAVTVRWILGSAILLLILLAAGSAWMIKTDAKANEVVMKWYATSVAGIIGLVVIGGTFAKMNRGIRQQNLKAIGITLIAVLVVILALEQNSAVQAAISLLSAMAGYLFGKDSSSDDDDTPTKTNG